MNSRAKLWIIHLLIYAVFVAWYTDFAGPLSEAEIVEIESSMRSNQYAPEQIDLVVDFARSDTGKQFLMLNAIDYNENPPFVDGANQGDNAEKLIARYMEHMLPAMLKRASHPVLLGPAFNRNLDTIGFENAENWDAGAVMRYRSRRTFTDIVSNPEFIGRHEFKIAALDKTIAYPIESRFYLGDLRVVLGLFLLSLTALLDNRLLARRLKQLK